MSPALLVGLGIPVETIKPVGIARKIDSLELAMLAKPELLVDMALTHRHVQGLYAREILMKAGTLLTSKTHKTEHLYVVLSGRVSVFIPDVGVQHIQAPYVGITYPGTRRVLYIHEDCRWITFHPTPDGETDLEVLEDRLIERRELADGTTVFDHYKNLMDLQQKMLEELPSSDELVGAP